MDTKEKEDICVVKMFKIYPEFGFEFRMYFRSANIFVSNSGFLEHIMTQFGFYLIGKHTLSILYSTASVKNQNLTGKGKI